jgi:hypothetical protein
MRLCLLELSSYHLGRWLWRRWAPFSRGLPYRAGNKPNRARVASVNQRAKLDSAWFALQATIYGSA